ncbi:G-protein coupled receptor GRL101 [Aplysia californica]|uniref:G-protein coupled receptor GRL101 n=1 Tax=Aplysia californica TaxID=6500 RepID=A0ABM1AE82_APLCA|nr:G-protein coupled receptor GRL101 [Aplysia californica]
MRCDGTNDCYDWSDEMNCADDEDCPYGHRRCASGQCIPEYKWCNRWPNCPDRSDEQDCDYAPCQPDEFTCSNGECVPLSLVCHGGRSADGRGCEDKSHLVHCDDHVCGEGQFKCRKSYCVDESQVCDNNGDCLNLSDEETCEHPCPYGQNLCMCYDQMMSCEGKGYRQLPIPNPLEQINKLQLSGNRLALNSTTFSGAGKHMDSVVYL